VNVFISLALIISSGMMMGLTGCPNSFKETSNQSTDAAYIFDAKVLMNAQSWDSALTKLNLVSATGQATRTFRSLKASVYAGRCGLNMISLVSTIGSGGATSLLPLLLNAFKSATPAQAADCMLARSEILNISTNALARTADENVFMAFIQFAIMGSTLAANSSIDTNNDGAIDGILGGCAPQLSNAELSAIGFGIMIFFSSLQAAGSSVSSGAVTSIAAACAQLTALPLLGGFCSKVDPTTQSYDANELKAVAWLVLASDTGTGFGECAIGSNCIAQCPIP
jgi:hypothetical protein